MDTTASVLRFKALLSAALGLSLVSAAIPLHGQGSGTDEVPEPALRLPAICYDGIPLAQGFEKHLTDRSVYIAQNVRFVWGADSPDQPAGVIASKYIPVNRSPREEPMVHTLDWYKRNHPDWIMYQADRVTPAYGYLYPGIGGFPPLNMSDPAVLDFYFKEFILPYIKQGYPMVAVDNVEFTNWEGRVGHYDQNGKWVRMFTGERNDPAYADSQIGRLLDLRRRLRPLGVAVAANISFNTASLDVIRRAVDSVDLWADEYGLAVHAGRRVTGRVWAAKFAFLREVLPEKAYMTVNKFPSYSVSREEMEWLVANFLLVRGPRTYLTLGRYHSAGAVDDSHKPDVPDPTGRYRGTDYGAFNDRPELKINLGRPTGPPTRDRSGAWLRSYEHGVVAVNPSPSRSASVPMPAGRWLDINSQTMESNVKLAPASAAILRDDTVLPLPAVSPVPRGPATTQNP